MLTRMALWAWVMLLSASCFGCADRNSDIRGSISGYVTLDGVPIHDGAIAFLPLPGTKGPAGGGEIKKGRFAIRLAQGPAIGRHAVQVTAQRPTGRKLPTPEGKPGADEWVEYVPDEYNKATTLNAEIKKGHNELNLDLYSQKATRSPAVIETE